MLYKRLLIAGVFVLAGWLVPSCKTKVQPETTGVERMPVDEITPGPLIHDTLRPDQLEKIMKIQRVFAEVNPSTLEETVDDFKKDQHPDNEIAIWLAMANAYEKFTANKSLDRNKKEEAYNLLLMRSMENEADAKAESNLHYLTDKEVAEIFSYYTLDARPVTVERP